MKLILTAALLTFFMTTSISFAQDTLMHESHEKLREAQTQMEIIKKTEDSLERKKLLDEHMKTMQEFSDITLKLERDPKRGDQGTIMADIMFERIRYLEQMMQQLLANQSEREKLGELQ